MSLGKAGAAGSGPDEFNQPTDVAVAANGDIYVADGHVGGGTAVGNARIVRFDRRGEYLGAFGKKGMGPGSSTCRTRSRSTRAAACSSPTARTTGCRSSTPDGKFVDSWFQFGRPSGFFIDRDDTIYVADSESRDGRTNLGVLTLAQTGYGFNPGARRGSASAARVTARCEPSFPIRARIRIQAGRVWPKAWWRTERGTCMARIFSARFASSTSARLGAAALVAAVAASVPAAVSAQRTTMRLLVSNGVKAALVAVQPGCEMQTGTTFAAEFDTSTGLRARASKGAAVRPGVHDRRRHRRDGGRQEARRRVEDHGGEDAHRRRRAPERRGTGHPHGRRRAKDPARGVVDYLRQRRRQPAVHREDGREAGHHRADGGEDEC